MKETTKPEGWFSRRHRSRTEHETAQMHHKSKAERRAEAETRNSQANPARYICGHIHGSQLLADQCSARG